MPPQMKRTTHPLVKPPRRLYELEDGRYIIFGGIVYHEEGRAGDRQSAACDADVAKCLQMLEKHEKQHVGR